MERVWDFREHEHEGSQFTAKTIIPKFEHNLLLLYVSFTDLKTTNVVFFFIDKKERTFFLS